jgi:hypothetical protein
MGQRHKKTETVEAKDFRSAGFLPSRPDAGWGAECRPLKKPNPELALPPLRTIKLAYRQLGYYQGRKVWETSLSFTYFH